MAIVTAGANFVAGAVSGHETTLFNNANSYIGVGNGNGVFAIGQTDLQGASKLRNGMETSYPLRTLNVLEFKSVFESADANFVWEECGVFNAAAAGTMMNRVVGTLGTKVVGEVWTMEATLEFDIT